MFNVYGCNQLEKGMLINGFELLRLREDQIHDHPYVLKVDNDCFDEERRTETENGEGVSFKEISHTNLGQNMSTMMEHSPQREGLGEVYEDEMDLEAQGKMHVEKIQDVLKEKTKDPLRFMPLGIDTVEEVKEMPLHTKEKEDAPREEDEKHLETSVEVGNDEEKGKPKQNGIEICPTRMICGRLYDFRCIYCAGLSAVSVTVDRSMLSHKGV